MYAGIGLALPLSVRGSDVWLVLSNAIGVTWGIVVLTGWFVSRVIEANRRNLVEWTTDLRLLSSEEFEWFAGEVFRREGWVVTETGRNDAPDGNVDLELARDGKRRIVQCKRWRASPVGVDEIRMFLGTLAREHLSGGDGIYVTLSTFTRHAQEEAEAAGIELIDNRELMMRVEKVRRPEPCPICRAPMLFDRSVRGWWFRCIVTGCKGKLDVANEPGRVLDFFVQRPAT